MNPMSPTLFTDAQLAEMQQQCATLLSPAHQMTTLLHQNWNLIQEVRASRTREAGLTTHNQALLKAHDEQKAIAEKHQQARDEVQRTANEHYLARQKLEEENAALKEQIAEWERAEREREMKSRATDQHG